MIKFYAFFIMFLAHVNVAEAVPAIVKYIIDGDTFSASVKLEDDISISVRVRIKNIDTPEIHGNCEYEINRAVMAKKRLAELIPVGTIVELTEIKDDKYLGRIDALVFNNYDQNVGDVLIQEGQARTYKGGKRQPWCDVFVKQNAG